VIHEVKVFDRNGKLKEIIPPQKARKNFWKPFEDGVNYLQASQQAHRNRYGSRPVFKDEDESRYD
jgi:hypothetical protein